MAPIAKDNAETERDVDRDRARSRPPWRRGLAAAGPPRWSALTSSRFDELERRQVRGLQRLRHAVGAGLETRARFGRVGQRHPDEEPPLVGWAVPLHDFVARERRDGRPHVVFGDVRLSELDHDERAPGEVDAERQSPWRSSSPRRRAMTTSESAEGVPAPPADVDAGRREQPWPRGDAQRSWPAAPRRRSASSNKVLDANTAVKTFATRPIVSVVAKPANGARCRTDRGRPRQSAT